MSIRAGLVGPKAMARAAADGHLVNIPELLRDAMERRGAVCTAHYWI
jgi:hypothetical protein